MVYQLNDYRHLVYRRFLASAKQRGIEVDMDFVEWWREWEIYWDRRESHQLCMCRYGDKGIYSPGNIYIAPQSHNIISGAKIRAAIKESWAIELSNGLPEEV